ncbi:MAG: energy-coupling factor transporter transmembrane protein EcfT [Treponema sp.]|nr:energy-coupling factor transporter transmembrane protein EcfT [Treponema sp.]
MTFNFDKLRSPQAILIFYVLISSLFILIFRFIFPGSEAPLFIYSRNWRFIQGALDVFNLFPALAFSALVIPFGFASASVLEEHYKSFSDIFFKRIISSVMTAIIAAIVYVIIFFFAMPMLKNYEENLIFSGNLYKLARRNMFASMEKGEWYEASQYIKICDRIWYRSEELEDAKNKIAINLEKQFFEETEEKEHARAAIARNNRDTESSAHTWFIQPDYALSENNEEIDATKAISLSRTAFEEKRYFDAHWLANHGMRLAVNGSAQQTNAARLASDAWNMISSQAPSHREERLLQLYNIKISGYQAMNSERWVDAYYIFTELLSLTPDDPDAASFLAVSELNAKNVAFFIDEMNVTLGDILNSALFSLPYENGRAVMRFSALTTSPDTAYGMDFEIMTFDTDNNLKFSVMSRYAKLTPFIKNDKPQLLVLTHSLDREDNSKNNQSVWLYGEENSDGIHRTMFILDISFEDFLLVSHIQHGLTNLQIDELFIASEKVETAGHILQVYQAEILNRLAAVLFFLPMAIYIIIISWRYRVKSRPRYFFVLMLPILPVVFHSLVFLYRAVFNTLGIWLILSFSFIPAIVILIVVLAFLLLISLITLAAQHS